MWIRSVEMAHEMSVFFSELRHVCELSDAIIRHVCDLILSEEIGSVYPPLARSGEWPRGGGAAGRPLFLTYW